MSCRLDFPQLLRSSAVVCVDAGFELGAINPSAGLPDLLRLGAMVSKLVLNLLLSFSSTESFLDSFPKSLLRDFPSSLSNFKSSLLEFSSSVLGNNSVHFESFDPWRFCSRSCRSRVR